jgi:DNA-binding FrmR family transcriptional regulator
MRGKAQFDSVDVLDRLNRAEGQLRGIKKMLEENRKPEDVVQQISAVRRALDQVFYISVMGQLQQELPKSEKTKQGIDKTLSLLTGFR